MTERSLRPHVICSYEVTTQSVHSYSVGSTGIVVTSLKWYVNQTGLIKRYELKEWFNILVRVKWEVWRHSQISSLNLAWHITRRKNVVFSKMSNYLTITIEIIGGCKQQYFHYGLIQRFPIFFACDPLMKFTLIRLFHLNTCLRRPDEIKLYRISPEISLNKTNLLLYSIIYYYSTFPFSYFLSQ